MNRRVLLLALVLCLLPALAPAANPSPTTAERPDLAWFFASRGYEGCFVAQAPQGLVRVNPARAAARYRPASTFKIVNALVAFESGVAPDAGFLLPWDEVTREDPDLNQDLTLEQAFRVSAVWCFVELAKLNGRERLGQALRTLAYGNADVSGSEEFWLDGPLRISAEEQVRALDRLARGQAPYSARSLELLRRIMLLEQGPDWKLYAKTGTVLRGGGPPEAGGDAPVGWIVGWVERGGQAHAFALNMGVQDRTRLGPDFAPARLEIAKALLRELGVLPQP